jgi:UDP-glucose 4-epimerase
MKKILVTGGAGFIGGYLVNKLIKNNYDVMVVDCLKPIGGIPYIHPKCFFVKGDILMPETLAKIKKWKPKIIFHLAAQSGGESAYDNPKFDYLTNGYGTYLLSKLAKEIKVKHFIYSSSVAVYGSNIKNKITEKSKIIPDSIYGISKYAGEMFIKQVLGATNVKTTVFRIFNTYGPGENLNFLKKGMVSIYCSYIWKNQPIIVKGSLKRFRNYQYIEDVVNILFKTIKNKKLAKNEIFNLSSGVYTTVISLIKLILKIKNKPNYKVIAKRQGTLGDSFGFHASNNYLKKKFNNYKFFSLEEGLINFFEWIDTVPPRKNLKYFHPLKKNIR